MEYYRHIVVVVVESLIEEAEKSKLLDDEAYDKVVTIIKSRESDINQILDKLEKDVVFDPKTLDANSVEDLFEFPRLELSQSTRYNPFYFSTRKITMEDKKCIRSLYYIDIDHYYNVFDMSWFHYIPTIEYPVKFDYKLSIIAVNTFQNNFAVLACRTKKRQRFIIVGCLDNKNCVYYSHEICNQFIDVIITKDYQPKLLKSDGTVYNVAKTGLEIYDNRKTCDIYKSGLMRAHGLKLDDIGDFKVVYHVYLK